MNLPRTLKVIAFDADDTLWDCQPWFDNVERQYCEILGEWGSMEYIHEELFKTEMANMDELGYGSKAFTLSLIENAIRVSKGCVTAEQIMDIERLGRSLLRLPATPLPGVEATLAQLRADGRYVLVLFTKGDTQEQLGKLRRSGLAQYFHRTEIVDDKRIGAFRELCEKLGISAHEMLMVGNSFKSDVEPMLQLGGWALHVPYEVTWAHEQTEEYEHPRLRVIDQFADIPRLLGTDQAIDL